MSPTLPPDNHLRALQRQAEQSVSPATLARLRSARHGRAASPPERRPMRWLPMALVGGLALLAVGVHLQTPPASSPAVAPLVAAMENDVGSLDETAFAENPDLYLWLGATDLAME